MIDNFKIEQSFIDTSIDYRKYNELVSSHFFRYHKETNLDIHKRTSERVSDCNKIWQLNSFYDINVKEVKKQSLCKNKFCFNCKKVLQACRMSKYSSLILEQSNIYHCVLTVPSVRGEDLKPTLKQMALVFKRFKGILFQKDKFGFPFPIEFTGALRSLEITYSSKGFHPHYHIIFSTKNKIVQKKTHTNKFSYSYGELSRCFSELELYLQRLWFCLFNNIRLSELSKDTKCYSVIFDEFNENDFLEIFKYLIKENVYDKDTETSIKLPYHFFKYVYIATYRMKQLQGYGVFYSVKDDIDVEEMKEGYQTYLDYLHTISRVEMKYEFISKRDYDKEYNNLKNKKLDYKGFKKHFGIVDTSKYKYISFKKYVKLVQNPIES